MNFFWCLRRVKIEFYRNSAENATFYNQLINLCMLEPTLKLTCSQLNNVKNIYIYLLIG